MPSAAAWPYVLASVAIHIVYYLALAQAYSFGDLGQVYPIARGTAPLMTAVLATLWLGETLGPLRLGRHHRACRRHPAAGAARRAGARSASMCARSALRC